MEYKRCKSEQDTAEETVRFSRCGHHLPSGDESYKYEDQQNTSSSRNKIMS